MGRSKKLLETILDRLELTEKEYGSLFHYKELEIREVKEYLKGRDIPVRL